MEGDFKSPRLINYSSNSQIVQRARPRARIPRIVLKETHRGASADTNANRSIRSHARSRGRTRKTVRRRKIKGGRSAGRSGTEDRGANAELIICTHQPHITRRPCFRHSRDFAAGRDVDIKSSPDSRPVEFFAPTPPRAAASKRVASDWVRTRFLGAVLMISVSGYLASCEEPSERAALIYGRPGFRRIRAAEFQPRSAAIPAVKARVPLIIEKRGGME